MKIVEATCPGTCGELLEGTYQGHQVLVSLPINIFSKAKISGGGKNKLSPSDWSNQLGKIQKFYPKAWSSFRVMLAGLGQPLSRIEGLDIELSSGLPRGKGMSSSTADMVALMGAGAGYLGQSPSPKDLTRTCQKLEATDSNLFPSLTLMDEDDGSLLSESGWSPAFSILVLEPDQSLDTQGFYGAGVKQAFNRQEGAFRQVLALYHEAVKEENLELLGQASLLSAQLNQAIAPKPYFEEIQSLAQDFPVFGLVTAHSGTVLGFLVRDEDRGPGLEEGLVQALEKIGAGAYYQKVYWAHSCYNGLEIRSCSGGGSTC